MDLRALFRVLGVFTEIVTSTNVPRPNGGPEFAGRACFQFFNGLFRNEYGLHIVDGRSRTDGDICGAAYQVVYAKFDSYLGHYFRTLYNLVKLVDRSGVSDKRFYMNLVRAQLSNQELLLLFYNCQTKYGSEKFKPLIEKYALLKCLPVEQLLSREHKSLYAPSAYGE
jgi:Putative phage abortive infection protein